MPRGVFQMTQSLSRRSLALRMGGRYISFGFAATETELQKDKIICIISQDELAAPPHDPSKQHSLGKCL